MYTYVHVHTHTCTHTYMYTHIHVHIRTYAVSIGILTYFFPKATRTDKHNYIIYSIRESTAYKLYVVLEVRFKVKGMSVNNCDSCGGSGQLVEATYVPNTCTSPPATAEVCVHTACNTEW